MSDALKVFAFVLMVVSFFLFHTWIRTQVLTTGYDLAKTQKRIRQLDSKKFSLKIERSRLLSPQSLEKLVSDFERKGVVFQSPESSQLHYLKIEADSVHVSQKD